MPDLLPPVVALPATVMFPTTGMATRFIGTAPDVAVSYGFYDAESGVEFVRGGFYATAALVQTAYDFLEGAPPATALRSVHDLEFDLPLVPPGGGAQLPKRAHDGAAFAHNATYHFLACAIDRYNHTSCAPPYSFLVDLTPPVCNTPKDGVGGVVFDFDIFSRR